MATTRSTATARGAKLPQDHALRAEALDAPVRVELDGAVTGAGPIAVDVPRDVVDSYEAVSAVYSGFTMPIMQALAEGDRGRILEAARDDTGKTRNSVVQRILVAALTQAAQGN